MSEKCTYTFKLLKPETWSDFETLMGNKGGYAGCWCMWWRLTRKMFEQGQGEGNRLAFKKIVDSGTICGMLAYADGQPCGWCSFATRDEYASLNRSPVLKKIDDDPVWSITCFFIKPSFRGQNIGFRLIQATVHFIKLHGGHIIEAYPSVLKNKNVSPLSSFMGIPKIFQRSGFKVVKQASESKLIMRLILQP